MSIVPARRIAITASTSQRGSIDSYISKLDEDGGWCHARKSMCANFILVNHPFLSIHIISNSILRYVTVDRQQTNNREVALASMIDTTTRKKAYYLSHAKFVLKHS